MSEEEVKEKKIPYECGIARFRETSRGHIMGLDTGLMKMIFSIKTRRLLGVHIIGEGATELIHIGQAVLNLKGSIEYFHREHLQLSDARRSLQDRRARRLEPDAAPGLSREQPLSIGLCALIRTCKKCTLCHAGSFFLNALP